MAATIATMAMLNAKCINSPKTLLSNNPPKQIPTKPTSLLLSKPSDALSTSLAGTAVAGAFFSALSACEPAFAAQQIAQIAAEGSDNRGLALLLPIIPALGWVLFNILQPALNQINKMRSVKGVVIGLGGLGAAGFMATPHASASEIATIAEAVNDNRGQLLLFVVTPALAWVAYNILQPALNQINKMRR